jgi:hypothetical protein
MDFETQLKSWCNTERGPYRHPFAPNPNWRSAQVMIIGTNHATLLRNEFGSFDEYWNSLTVDPAAFDKYYSAQHKDGASKSTKWTKNLFNVLESNAAEAIEVERRSWGEKFIRAMNKNPEMEYDEPYMAHVKPAGRSKWFGSSRMPGNSTMAALRRGTSRPACSARSRS